MATMYPSKKTGFVETVLWTNSSPTSNFAQTDVDLTDDISNYAYLKLKFKPKTSATTSCIVIVDSEEFLNLSNIGIGSIRGTIVTYETVSGSTKANYIRNFYNMSNTQIRIEACYRVKADGTKNNYNIPLEIVGLKF